MITSNSSVDFISVAKAQGMDPAEFMQSEEFREWFNEYLSDNAITVRFTKKDGTERSMFCTRNLGLIPEEHQPKTNIETSKTDNVRVYDLVINEWRSFNISAINHIDWTENA